MGRQAEPPLHQMVHRHLNFDDLFPPAVESNDDEEEEDIPTAFLDDLVWPEESIPERDLCIHMAAREPETGYPSQIPIQPQEPIYESAILIKHMDSMITYMPNLINIPKKCTF